jgi:hypothetical protein
MREIWGLSNSKRGNRFERLLLVVIRRRRERLD